MTLKLPCPGGATVDFSDSSKNRLGTSEIRAKRLFQICIVISVLATVIQLEQIIYTVYIMWELDN